MTPLIKRLELDREYYFAEGCYINELSNAEHDPAVSIARARVPVRYLIEAGQGEVYLDTLAPQRVSAGDVVLIPAGCAQRIGNTGDDELVFLAICSPRFQPQCYQDLES